MLFTPFSSAEGLSGGPVYIILRPVCLSLLYFN